MNPRDRWQRDAVDGAPARPASALGGSPLAGGRPKSAPATPIAWESRFLHLSRALDQFRVDIERFFNGALTIPPEELRDQIVRELRELRASPIKSSADQFRLGSYEARFNSLSELYGRRLRGREEGHAPMPVQLTGERPRHDAGAGIVVSSRLDGSAVEALWLGLTAAGGGARLELETFRSYLSKQINEIRSRTGSEAVQFRVVHEEGRLKLKARPVVDPGATS